MENQTFSGREKFYSKSLNERSELITIDEQSEERGQG
jgi:hypothetical protein